MSKLEKAIISLNSSRSEILTDESRDPRAVTVVTLIYLVSLLSVSLTSIAKVIWFGLFPIVVSQMTEGGYSRVLKRSLFVLPIIAFIGIFNPILDRRPVFTIGSLAVSQGWVTFVSILLRGLWAVQAVIAMTGTIGFNGFCRGLRRIGVPSFLTTQLMMVYRYLGVLLEEALKMRRARESRGFGRKSMPLKMWGTMIGELFVRTVDRAEKVYSAMLSRGFSGEIPYRGVALRWSVSDTVYMVVWLSVFGVLRFLDPSVIFGKVV